MLSLDWDDGSEELLTDTGPERRRDRREVGRGQRDRGRRHVRRQDGLAARRSTYTVTGTFTDNTDFIGDYAASDVNADAFGEANDTTNVFVELEPGADAAAVQTAIDDAARTSSRP